MIHAFVDTNVLIDFLGQRPAFFKPARKLITFAFDGTYDLWMSVPQSTNLFYILTEGGKASKSAAVKKSIGALLDKVHVVSSIEHDMRDALATDIDDYEDALILASAMSAGADVIITRDAGLKNGLIPTCTPEEFFGWLKEKHHVEFAQMELHDGGTWRQTL